MNKTENHNISVLARYRGVPSQSGTTETDSDPRNPNCSRDKVEILVTGKSSKGELAFVLSEILLHDPVVLRELVQRMRLELS